MAHRERDAERDERIASVIALLALLFLLLFLILRRVSAAPAARQEVGFVIRGEGGQTIEESKPGAGGIFRPDPASGYPIEPNGISIGPPLPTLPGVNIPLCPVGYHIAVREPGGALHCMADVQ